MRVSDSDVCLISIEIRTKLRMLDIVHSLEPRRNRKSVCESVIVITYFSSLLLESKIVELLELNMAKMAMFTPEVMSLITFYVI